MKLYETIGRLATEKLASLISKIQDDTATTEDKLHAEILGEIIAMAKNRIAVNENEHAAKKGSGAWVERTSQSHFPHIRLHGGALEDDPLLNR
ncbi:hypothetical protein [Chlorobium phaeobacteroides]|jgi:hypothetical protein|uniref:Uncharacterized protein n=1 Tax=Chlorobium phaeobacteroides (strain DSM 266 / SMG 266 / 2430) TaxID=290317 RepID=A1BHS7_CHLPD|nr:hypothetical protein [Chlorobium phaeobacteroides]ABL65954.1 conserved hypothetical protein [Chlorobium phaeobacteroides DSM 266]MBV5327697.1 hypothetical protein [Chlorobium sp.]